MTNCKLIRHDGKVSYELDESIVQMAFRALRFWLDDMKDRGVEGGMDEPWYAHDVIARQLCEEEYSYED